MNSKRTNTPWRVGRHKQGEGLLPFPETFHTRKAARLWCKQRQWGTDSPFLIPPGGGTPERFTSNPNTQ
jgi:hypothetical protein